MTFLGVSALLVLAVLIFFASRLVLPACGSVFGWFGAAWDYCPSSAAAVDTTTQDEQNRRADLLARIARLEGQLSSLHCPVQTTQSDPVDGPDFAENSDNERRFEDGDNSVLEGCWALDQTLTFTHLTTRVETKFDQWQMCFDAQGNGTQKMVSSDGRVTCEGQVPGDIAQGGVLSIIEPDNLQCSDNTFIYRRDITCRIDADGFLVCQSFQPEVNTGEQPFRMRRE